jgi:hypothetical protein
MERELIRRRARSTGTEVVLVDRGDYDDGHRWETICADHGGVCSHETRKLAEQWLPHPDEWCEDCMHGEGTLSGEKPVTSNATEISEGAKVTLDYLRLTGTVQAEVFKHNMCGKADGFHYLGYEQLVLREGVIFKDPVPTTRKFRRTKMGDCFENALHAAMDDSDLTYCEGYAYSGLMPMHHAWVVDEDGEVHDPTWGTNERDHEASGYVGVAFDLSFACGVIHRREMYGMLDHGGVDLSEPLDIGVATVEIPNTVPVPDEYKKPHEAAVEMVKKSTA